MKTSGRLMGNNRIKQIRKGLEKKRMKSREYHLAAEEDKARKQMIELILASSRFTSSITVENEYKHFNGKSILKAGELKKGDHFYVVAEGSDAKEAIEVFDSLF